MCRGTHPMKMLKPDLTILCRCPVHFACENDLDSRQNRYADYVGDAVGGSRKERKPPTALARDAEYGVQITLRRSWMIRARTSSSLIVPLVVGVNNGVRVVSTF